MRPLAILLALAGALALPSLAVAAPFEVDRVDDPPGPGQCLPLIANDCSLRQAVALAAVAPDADVISVAGITTAIGFGSEITYGGSGPLTIIGATHLFTHVHVDNDHALRVLAGAGPVHLAYLWLERYDALTPPDRSVLVDESAAALSTSFVSVLRGSPPATSGATVRIDPPTGMRGSATFVDSGIFDGPSGGATMVADRSTVVVQGSTVEVHGAGTGIAATGASSVRVVGTRISSDTGTPIDLGDGSLILRHATLTTSGSVPLAATAAGATIDTGYSLLAGGATCFGVAATTSVGFNFTEHTAGECPELTSGSDATALPHPGIASIDALATCGNDGAGGTVSSDLFSMRPVDGDGDGVARCDVGAREHGTEGALGWQIGSADPHVGDTLETRLLVARQFRPGSRHSTISIPVPAALTLARVAPSAGITCTPGATLVCSVADGDADLETQHDGFVDLTLVAVASATVQLVATERDETTVTIDPGEQTTAVSTWASSPFTVRITPTPPPPIIDPPIVKHFPNAYAGCTIVGTSGADHIVGTAKSDVICALGGNDVIDGKGGGDHIIGGDGKDRIDGGAGKDWIEGGPGNDRLHGGAGADLISGGLGRDRIWGGAGDDRLSGGRGFDVLDGQAGKDRATGAAHDRTKRIEHGAAKRKTRAKKS